MDIGEVHFHEGNLHGGQCVSQGHARVGVGGRVDHDARHTLLGGLVDEVDQDAFMVALVAGKADLMRLRKRLERGVDFIEGGGAIDRRLTLPQTIEVGPVEDPEQRFGAHQWWRVVNMGASVPEQLISCY